MPKRKGRRGKREKCVCTRAHVYKRMLTEELTKMLREMSSLCGEETGGNLLPSLYFSIVSEFFSIKYIYFYKKVARKFKTVNHKVTYTVPFSLHIIITEQYGVT